MPKREGRNSRSNALTLARNIKSIRSYVDDGVGWVEILFNGNRELAIRFEVPPAVANRVFLAQYRSGNSQLIRRFKVTTPSRERSRR